MPKYRDDRAKLSKEKLLIFASRIKALREEREISQETLGNYIGYSRSAISSFENGTNQPDLTTIMAYADFFDVTADYLVGDTDVRKPLYRVACSTDITAKDFGKLSPQAQKEIESFVNYVLEQERKKKSKK